MVKPNKLFWEIAVFSVLKKLLWGVLILTTAAYAQKENKFIRSGNNLFEGKNYKDAEIDYMKALEKNPSSFKGQYNLGGALYKQDNYEDASKLYNNLAGQGTDNVQKANTFYNLGNSLVKAKKYPESIEAYKNALRLNPGDQDAKYNMEFAKRMLQQEQNKDQNKDQDKKDDQNKDQQKQDQQKQDEQKQDEQKQDQQKQDQQQQNQQQQNQQQQHQQQPQQLSKQEAERMLEALKNDETKTMEKLMLQKLQQMKTKKVEKDW
jgi:Ca-activated chloride channel homolog